MTATFVYEVADLRREFALPRQRPFEPRRCVVALRGVGLVVHEGEALGIVGESGSGKSTLARLLLALDQPQRGSIRYRGGEITRQPHRELQRLRREVQMVFQDPHSSLDPRMRVGASIVEPLRALRVASDHRGRLNELLDMVGIPRAAAGRYPHEFSGGQLQRIAIARALAPHPRVLVADEPVSALDVSIQAQILNLLMRLRQDLKLTLILISHDLAVVSHVTDRVVVMKDGQVVEEDRTERVFSRPRHPYTRRLLSSVLTLNDAGDEMAGQFSSGIGPATDGLVAP